MAASRVLTAMAIWGLLGSNAFAQAVTMNVVDFGIYTTQEKSTGKTKEGIETSIVGNVRHAVTTHSIPLQRGVTFGYRLVIQGPPKGSKVPLRTVFIYPPPGALPPHANKRLPQTEEVSEAVVGGTVLRSYELTDPWELLPGKWTIEVWYQGRKFISQSFDVHG